MKSVHVLVMTGANICLIVIVEKIFAKNMHLLKTTFKATNSCISDSYNDVTKSFFFIFV